MSDTRTIRVENLARVEGEGALYVTYSGDRIEHVALKIFEPPRFFEAFLRGRHYSEAPDITARICGICPVAYQMSSVHAMERILSLTVTPEIRKLRRLLYCGEWIESHVLHMFMLHAPDFFGLDNVAQLAQRQPEVVQKALRLKQLGNKIIELLGGRAVHPVNVRVGGFYRWPPQRLLDALRVELEQGAALAEELVHWVAKLDFPLFERPYHFVSLHHADEYPMNEGDIVSNQGLHIDVAEYESLFSETQVPHSHALHSHFQGHAYVVGPMARYHLNHEQLSERTRRAAHAIGFSPICNNPFQSIIVRALEVLFAFDEAVRLLDGFSPTAPAFLDAPVVAGMGCAATEAPRGLLYHRYQLDASGTISEAKIVPPTSQNQASMETDLAQLVSTFHGLPEEQLKWKCEQAIRNFDPCISCATHFLKWIRL